MSLAGLPLLLAPCGQVEVTAIAAGDPAIRARLHEMGISVGRRMQLLQAEGDDGVVVALGHARFALGQGMARTILVSPLKERDGGRGQVR